MDELKLHDIKDIVEIPDNSIYYFSALLLFTLLAVALAGWQLYRFMQRKKAVNWQAYYLEQLKKLDLGDSKAAAYAITEYGEKLAKTEEQKKLYEAVNSLLDAYKYKKSVADFDEETLQKLHLFLSGFDQ